MRAAVELVTERGTAAVPLSDIAEAADVSQRVVYQHFGDRDALLLEAGLDLARRELLPQLADAPPGTTTREQTLATARHFAGHRVFYRALLTGSCAFALDRGLIGLLLVNRQHVQQMFSDRLDPQIVEDLATCLAGGGSAFFTTWIVDGAEPLEPQAFTDRLMRMRSVLIAALSPTTRSPDLEIPR
ncbi:TetR/AcrR family transcriptional regulator [Streptomyces bottropensis]|uniref:TetR/AcrR family transcriptional regulator n=1 Tax=Streptomyces bottropensis TaxID=42235 RepID=UPI00367655A4